DLAELHRVALSGGQTLELDHVALSDPVLLATGDDHGFHEAASSENRGTRGCRKPRFDHTDAGLSTLGGWWARVPRGLRPESPDAGGPAGDSMRGCVSAPSS